jgi:hypothetical protein
MARSEAKSVAAYMKELPAERRAVVSKVRAMVLKNLPKGYEEMFDWGCPSYGIPLSRYPDTYNKKPLYYVAIGAQKNYYAIYLMSVYQDPRQLAKLKAAFEKAGKKLNMGKSCVRFKKLEDIPLDAIGKIIASTTPATYIKEYEKIRGKA